MVTFLKCDFQKYFFYFKVLLTHKSFDAQKILLQGWSRTYNLPYVKFWEILGCLCGR